MRDRLLVAVVCITLWHGKHFFHNSIKILEVIRFKLCESIVFFPGENAFRFCFDRIPKIGYQLLDNNEGITRFGVGCDLDTNRNHNAFQTIVIASFLRNIVREKVNVCEFGNISIFP